MGNPVLWTISTKVGRSFLIFSVFITLISVPVFASEGGKISISVKEARFGAKGDGINDDTGAIQKAVDWVYKQGGGKIIFPPGTYIVTSVNIREGITYEGYGATIKRPDNLTDKIGQKAAKWVRTFTNQKYPYSGENDSHPLIIRGLTFDGSSQTQGPYQKYELEQAALVFLMGDKKKPGRLTAVVEDCTFKNGVGDGVHAYVNTHLKMHNCTAENVFRGGFVLTGGHSVAEVKNLTTRGEVDPTGIDVEVDGAGYGGSYKVEVYLENLNLVDGDFDVGVRDGSRVVGKNIRAEAPFNLYVRNSTAHFQDCRFGVAPGNRLNFPYRVSFDRCEFYVSSRVKSREYKHHSASPIIVWSTSYAPERDQKLKFQNCRFILKPENKKNPDSRYFGLLTGWDDLDRNNVLEIEGGAIEGPFDVGVGMRYRGGRWRIRDLRIDGDLAFSWTGFATELGRSFSDILLEGIKIHSKRYMHIDGYPQPNDNRLEHRQVIIPAAANFLSSTYGLEGNQYVGHRIIQGSQPPTSATHGLPGDIYQLLDGSRRWRCTKAGYLKLRDGKETLIEARWEEMPAGAN
jgi:hypothetical protein